MPALFGNAPQDTIARVKCDYRETLSDLHLAYVRRWSEWSRAHASLSRNQAHGAPGNLIDLYAAADIPETEIFASTDERHIPMHKFSSSAAHLTGRTLASSESFTWLGEHFQVSLADVKPAADFLFISGVNHIFFHGIPYSPQDVAWPGWLFYASVNLGPNGGLWHDLPAFNAYLARCQSVLQSGQPANDVLLYWPIYDTWQTPAGLLMQFTVHDQSKWLWSTPFYEAAMKLWSRGYAFDEVSDRLLRDAKCIDGRIELGGNAYRVIVVPNCRLMPVATLRKLAELTREGAKVIVRDSLPADVPGFADLPKRRGEFGEALAALSRQHVQIGTDLDAMLAETPVARETMVDAGLSFVRRTHERGHHYFVVNRSERAVDGWIALGTPAEAAVILDPRYENVAGVAALRQEKSTGLAQIYLQLQPGESCVVRTFTTRDAVARAAAWSYAQVGGEPHEIAGTWHVHFLEGGPALPADFETRALTSWATRDDAEARRFAGTARYHVEFEHSSAAADDWMLDLGRVCESARVKLNGRDVVTLWSRPFQVRLGEFLRPGRNTLEIEVTNLAANRIADLDRRGVNWKSFHEINFVNKDYKPFDASHWPPRDSGLLGPVRLIPLRQLDPGAGK